MKCTLVVCSLFFFGSNTVRDDRFCVVLLRRDTAVSPVAGTRTLSNQTEELLATLRLPAFFQAGSCPSIVITFFLASSFSPSTRCLRCAGYRVCHMLCTCSLLDCSDRQHLAVQKACGTCAGNLRWIKGDCCCVSPKAGLA